MRAFLRFVLAVIAVVGVIAIPLAAGWYLLDIRTEPSGSNGSVPAGRENALSELISRLRPANPDERAGNDPSEVTFEIKPGETARSISERLKEAGLIRNPDSFRALLRVQGVDKQLEAGSYRLRRNMTVGEIVTALQHGRPPTKRVTIPEGRRSEEIAALLQSAGLVDGKEFLQLVKTGTSNSYGVLRDRPEGASLEGYLFPDTYEIPEDWTAQEIVDLMVRTADGQISAEMRQQVAQGNLNLHQVFTLASIVEREAAVPAERPIIASVYLNRLTQGMKLDADPTVQYALGYDDLTQTWWRTLLLDDLETDSPYNTYVNAGLPPAPISNPGLASIQAVLQPADTNYLYFVANAIAGDGSHVFAQTFEEHQSNIAQYGQR